jgi:hypothetical protein
VFSETFPECLGAAHVSAAKEVKSRDQRLRSRWTSLHSQHLWPDELVNESDVDKLRHLRTERDKLLKKRSTEALQDYVNAAEERKLQLESEIAAARMKQQPQQQQQQQQLSPGLAPTIAKQPNAHFDLHMRHGKHLIFCKDGRSKLLTRVFLNGRWTYTT